MACAEPKKHRYPTQAKAWSAIRALGDKVGDTEHLRPVQCKKHWHIEDRRDTPLDKKINRALR